MPRIVEEELNRLKCEIDLVALIRSKGVELTPQGKGGFVGRCPFHQDQNQSLLVNQAENQFQCSSCGASGHVIDFLMKYEGLSFRHAVELLRDGQAAKLVSSSDPIRKATVPKLQCPLNPEADDAELKKQALGYYQERLRQSPHALEYLKRRGIDAAIDPFGIGFADRTLGLRLPMKNRKEGAVLRERLQHLGLIRQSGHEHFTGCVVFPIYDVQDKVTQIYGRKINHNLRSGTSYHLYLPGPHTGIFNRACLSSTEVILCQSVIDALTFWVNGLRQVTCIYGTEGFTEELLEAFRKHKTGRVYLAYGRDEAGEQAAARDAEKLQSYGIECFRIQFPPGMDANEYAGKALGAQKLSFRGRT